MALLLLSLALVLSACNTRPESAPAEIIVSAAASLSDVLRELQPAFEGEHQAVRLRFNFGSSGALQKQIEGGAPADLFIAAATGPMEMLIQRGIVEPAAVRTLAFNRLVLIRGRSADAAVSTWVDLRSAQVKRIALGNPAHVPAGQYGQAVLERLGLWSAVEGRLVLGEDARQVLNYVESGEVAAGIVYRTDAAQSQKVVVVAEAPAGSHPAVAYPMAVLKESRHAAEAQAFADFLLSERGKQTLTKYGFEVTQP